MLTLYDFSIRHILREPVSRVLPRGQPALNLMSLTSDEIAYREQEAAISVLVNHPDIDGVYESQVPLIVRALIKLGNRCNPNPKASVSLSRALDQGFNLDDLITPTTVLNKRPYLDGGRGLKYAYLYHSNMDSRHVLCYVLPSGGARLYIVDKGRNRELPNMERYYVEAKAELDARAKVQQHNRSNVKKNATALIDYPTSLKIDVSYHAEPDSVYRLISRELNSLQSRKQGATVLAICSAKPRTFYETAIPYIQQFPTVMVPSSKVDNTYPTRLLWQGPAAKRMVQHYLRLSTWLKDRMELAHKADVPM